METSHIPELRNLTEHILKVKVVFAVNLDKNVFNSLIVCLHSFINLFTFCLPVFLSFCVFVFLTFCLPAFCLCVPLCSCLSVFLPIRLSVFLSFCLSVFLSFCLSVFLSFSPSFIISILLFLADKIVFHPSH